LQGSADRLLAVPNRHEQRSWIAVGKTGAKHGELPELGSRSDRVTTIDVQGHAAEVVNGLV